MGADVDAWSEKYWSDFDEDWWREQVAQGRLFRSRIDLFLQYWLTMRTQADVPTDDVFALFFRDYSASALKDPATAEDFLQELRRDADTFHDFAAMDESTGPGRFYARVVEAFELGVFIPVLLWIISPNYAVPLREADVALSAIESWVVRRTLLRQTMKDTNNLVVAMFKLLDREDGDAAGVAIRQFLGAQDADSRRWPTDAELRQQLPSVCIYESIKQPRIRSEFAALELGFRTARHEAVSLPAHLEIEHVMPRGWRDHWGADIASDPEARAARDTLISLWGT